MDFQSRISDLNFYNPRTYDKGNYAAVNFIFRAVDDILKTEFDLPQLLFNNTYFSASFCSHNFYEISTSDIIR